MVTSEEEATIHLDDHVTVSSKTRVKAILIFVQKLFYCLRKLLLKLKLNLLMLIAYKLFSAKDTVLVH